MNIKRLTISSLACFAFIFVFNYFYHHVMMGEMYQATSHLWRAESEMGRFFPFALLSQLLTAVIIAMIYLKADCDQGFKGGVAYGTVIGAFLAVLYTDMYPYMPIPNDIALLWGLSGILIGLGCGVILAFLKQKVK